MNIVILACGSGPCWVEIRRRRDHCRQQNTDDDPTVWRRHRRMMGSRRPIGVEDISVSGDSLVSRRQKWCAASKVSKRRH